MLNMFPQLTALLGRTDLGAEVGTDSGADGHHPVLMIVLPC